MEKKPIEDFYLQLGARIAVERNDARRRWTQEQLGALLQPRLTRAAISNIESGKQRVLAHTLAQIARAFDLRVDDLIPARSTALPAQHVDFSAVLKELKSKIPLTPQQVKNLTRALAKEDDTNGNPTRASLSGRTDRKVPSASATRRS